VADVDESEPVEAGDFGEWLGDIARTLRDGEPADVACGSCTACCTASQFVGIEPDERDTLDHIPKSLLFPAPRAPAGHVLMGYDERGHCPMLVDGGCSIYEHRPRACRTYDCRVFAATGIVPDDPAIAARAVRWRFGYSVEGDRDGHDRLVATAREVGGDPASVPVTLRPRTATQAAIVAIRRHLEADGHG
jgi:Fe-S-cluster containining protein